MIPAVFEQEFVVSHLECDPWDRMTPRALLRRVQEISTAHCEAIGLTDEVYRQTHTVFLLSKISLEVAKAPAPGQRVRIHTHGYGMKRAVYTRVTALYDAASGEKLAETDSRWVLVDTDANRILRAEPPAVEGLFTEQPPAQGQDMQFPKTEEPPLVDTLTANYSLCDRNGHVNNTSYADIVCDHLPIERLAKAPLRKMLLHYHAEIPMGQAFSLAGIPVGADGYYFVASVQGKKDFEGFVSF